MKILIAEDNAYDRKILKLNLERHGCEVIEASDGAKGLHLAGTQHPDLIISDALMPVMDGFQFLRSIKTDKTLKSIPFIFYSAVYAGDKETELALSLGAETFIVKPKDLHKFWDEIAAILEGCKKKGNPTATLLLEEEEEFLRKYSHIVATKLEQEVKELEKAKANIEEKEKRYRNLFSSIRDVVITTDAERRIMDANQPALRELFGYEIEEIIGKTTRILYADDSGYDVTRKEIFDTDGSVAGKIIQVAFRKKNNEIFHGELCALKLLDDDRQTVGNLGLIRDITERKQAEDRIKNSLKEKTVMLREIHHRVKNNLAVIISLLSLQAKDIADEAVRIKLGEIENRLFCMSLIHENLYSSEDLAHIDFKEHLKPLVKSIADTYKRHDVICSVVMEPVVLEVNAGIPCGQIVNELVSNSLKHAFPQGRQGEVRVGISIDSEGNHVLFVEDNGIGLPANLDFQQPKTLGFQLVKGLIGQIRGKIELSRERGTRFRITFRDTPYEEESRMDK